MSFSAEQLLLQLMRERREATRPQLAAASGLSLVTVNKAVAQLGRRGLLQAVGSVSSGGGRPVQLYRFVPHAGYRALFRTEREKEHLRGTLELVDLLGVVVQRSTALFTRMNPASADDWLDAVPRRRRFGAIALHQAPEAMAEHLRERYGCPVTTLSSADAVAEPEEGRLTLCLMRGHRPEGTLFRNGCFSPCGELSLLPLPADWETLDYDDLTLVEEMLARLLLILCCTLQPQRIDLHSDYRSERLTTRLLYNLGTKLKNARHHPKLSFHDLTPPRLAAKLAEATAHGMDNGHSPHLP